MNPIKRFNNLMSHVPSQPTRARESRFVLSGRFEDYDLSKLSKESGHVPENAKSYSMITIGKKDNPDFQRYVVSFKDADGGVVRKIIAGTGMNSIIRDYQKGTFVKDGWNEFLEHRHIKTKEANPTTNTWELKQEEDQYIHLSTNKYKYQKGFARKLHIDKNEYIRDNEQEKVIATMTEYPYTLGFEDKSAKKVAGVDMTLKGHRPHINEVLPNTNVELPKDDEFLPFRFLLGEQKQTCLTQNVLDRKGIGNLGIGIYYSKDIVPQNSEGLFNHLDGNIYYKCASTAHPVKIAGHEGEHAYQYSLIARLGKLLSKFGVVCKTNLPPITDLKEMDKGYKYVVAAEKYPKISDTENLKNNMEYWNNDLEAGARAEAEKLAQLYEKGREFFQKIFPFSKSNTNF